MTRLKTSSGIVLVYTGTGKGKTTAALGMALRAVGQGQKAVMVQFMKRKGCAGEHKSAALLAPNFKLHTFGRAEFVDLHKPSELDRQLAREALEFAKSTLSRAPDILILDEINVAVSMGLVKLEEVLALVKSRPKDTSIILTGRGAPKELLALADIATEMRELKHHYDKGFGAKLGIDY
ncbi:MAG: cob(I)yrinic acid a,c-diamide adenosyltransferase [Candidatus Burarchaeum sp.]|nr:cob(I)yrinic acid a,c-diamide adenosyltransferase [Candidatus Burarchaeum sp.]MDO8339611.1 cob(I)yrinic acid a,c-diamide adenosyltransferase [Candidatus Burarchaeum sp.]